MVTCSYSHYWLRQDWVYGKSFIYLFFLYHLLITIKSFLCLESNCDKSTCYINFILSSLEWWLFAYSCLSVRVPSRFFIVYSLRIIRFRMLKDDSYRICRVIWIFCAMFKGKVDLLNQPCWAVGRYCHISHVYFLCDLYID